MESNELLTTIKQEFAELRGELDGKFAKIDEKFKGIDTRFDQVDTALKEAADEASQAHILIEAIRSDRRMFDEDEASPLDKRVSALEVRVTSLEGKRRK